MTETAEPRSRSNLAKPLTLAAMSLGFGVVQLDVTVVNTALDSIGASLSGGVSELQWVVSAYTVAFVALILTAGAFGDGWAPANLHGWLRRVHSRFVRLRAGADIGDFDRGAGRAGRRRGDPGAELAGAPQPRLS